MVNWSVKVEYYCDKDKDKPVFFTSESNLMEEFMSINDISFTVRDFSLKKINIYLLRVSELMIINYSLRNSKKGLEQ